VSCWPPHHGRARRAARRPHVDPRRRVGLGPGPFTGLRVGIVTGLALADALGDPVYGCCSLDAVAAWDEGEGRGSWSPDARRKEVYWAEYADDGERVAGPPS
jgi:tRNA threonylcarbamoyl adenosine modification protein YeaZ